MGMGKMFKLGDGGLLVLKNFDPKELDEAVGICVVFKALDYKKLSTGALNMIVGGNRATACGVVCTLAPCPGLH